LQLMNCSRPGQIQLPLGVEMRPVELAAYVPCTSTWSPIVSPRTPSVAAPWVPVGTHGTSLVTPLPLSGSRPSSKPPHACVQRSVSPQPRQMPSTTGMCAASTPLHPVAVGGAPVGNSMVPEQRRVIAPQVSIALGTSSQGKTAWDTPQSSPRTCFRALHLPPPASPAAGPMPGAATASSRSMLLPRIDDRPDCHSARRSASPTASPEQAALPTCLGIRSGGSVMQQQTPQLPLQQQQQQQQQTLARVSGAVPQPPSGHLCGSVKSGGSATLGSTLGSLSDSRDEAGGDVIELRRLLSASLAAQEVLLQQQQEQQALQHQSNEQLAACMAEFRATREELATISREVEVLRRGQQYHEGSNDQMDGRPSRPSSESGTRLRQRRAAPFSTPPSKDDPSREALSSAPSPARTASPPSTRTANRVPPPGPRSNVVGLRSAARSANSQSSGALQAMSADVSWQKLQQQQRQPRPQRQQQQQTQWQQQQQQMIWCPRSGGKREKRYSQGPG